MRLDRFLCQMNMGSRSDVKALIRKRLVTVNGEVALAPEQKIDEIKDVVACGGETLRYKPYVYYMMNKPQGVVTATTDRREKTVLELLRPFLPECDKKRELVPVGRLDKDTEGLLLLTDDGALVHSLLSPKKHVNKTYHAKIAKPLSEGDIHALEEGVDISGTNTDAGKANADFHRGQTPSEEEKTLPARVSVLEDRLISITIHEGKFHQVKRMLQAVDNEVLALKRVRFGPLSMDTALAAGECRELTPVEEQYLRYALLKHTDAKRKTKALMEGIQAVIFDLDGTLVDSFETIEAEWNQMAGEKYEREISLKSGVRDFLQDCKKRGIRLGIATSNSRKLVDRFLKGHGLEGYFDCIQTGCEGLKDKPAPDIYLAVAQGLGTSPEQCLVFEDILPGIAAGKAAGMRVCAVEDAYSAGIRAQKMELADGFITDYAEIAFVYL